MEPIWFREMGDGFINVLQLREKKVGGEGEGEYVT
jgi:hypothetical protein